MKKHKDRRRRHGSRPPSNKGLPAVSTKRSAQRYIGWVGGVGLVVVVGFFMFQKQRTPMGAGPAISQSTNSQTGLSQPGFVSPKTVSFEGPSANGTNRPGAALNKQAEGHAADLNNQGKHLLEAGDSKGAVPLFQEAVAITPENEVLHFNLAVALGGAGDTTNAEREYKAALGLVPDYPEAHHNYGNLLLRLKRYAEAEEQMAAAVDQSPESAEYQNSLGVVRQRRKATNEAVLCFKKALECDSNCWEAHFNLGLAYLMLQDRDKGITELRETLRLKPGLESAQRVLARTLGQDQSPGPLITPTPK